MVTQIKQGAGGERDLERGLTMMTMTPTPLSTQNPLAETSPFLSPSPSPSPSATAIAPTLVLSNSGKWIDQAGKKKYVKQVIGWHNDTELHLAAQRGNLAVVRQMLEDIISQMMGDLSGEELKAEVAEVWAAVVNEVNELEETVLFTAADKGYLDILKELLMYSSTKTLTKKNHVVGLIGYGFQKEKRKRNTDLCYGFCALKGIDDLGRLY